MDAMDVVIKSRETTDESSNRTGKADKRSMGIGTGTTAVDHGGEKSNGNRRSDGWM